MRLLSSRLFQLGHSVGGFFGNLGEKSISLLLFLKRCVKQLGDVIHPELCRPGFQHSVAGDFLVLSSDVGQRMTAERDALVSRNC